MSRRLGLSYVDVDPSSRKLLRPLRSPLSCSCRALDTDTSPGFHRGTCIGSVDDGVVTAFIPEAAIKRTNEHRNVRGQVPLGIV
jgi:hypothetical protein